MAFLYELKLLTRDSLTWRSCENISHADCRIIKLLPFIVRRMHCLLTKFYSDFRTGLNLDTFTDFLFFLAKQTGTNMHV